MKHAVLQTTLWILCSWILVSACCSLLGGWFFLSRRYRCHSAAAGERRYNLCLFAGLPFFGYGGTVLTLTSEGLGLALSPPVLLFHPRIFIPWGCVESCTHKSAAVISDTLVFRVRDWPQRLRLVAILTGEEPLFARFVVYYRNAAQKA
jgi:hypothetical protein